MRLSAVDALSAPILRDGMGSADDLIFVSLLRADAARYSARYSDIVDDVPEIRLLAAAARVLMKPEAETHVDALHHRIEESVAAAVRQRRTTSNVNMHAAGNGSGPTTRWRGDSARVQRVLDDLVAHGVPGAAATVWDAETGVHFFSSGYADPAAARPPVIDDHFRIASLTKIFVATVVLQLAAQGRLSLHDTLSRWLPHAVRGGAAITLRQILQHTARLPDFVDQLPQDNASRLREYAPGELVTLVADKPLLGLPAGTYSYSNTGFLLAGLVIEQVTGRNWRAEVRDRITTPLGLKETSTPYRETAIPRPHLTGHHFSSSGETTGPGDDVTRLSPTMADSAGEMISDSQDLITFARALFDGRLLPAQQLAEMTTAVPSPEPMDGYGLGLVRSDLACGTPVWGHGGKIAGFSSWLATNAEGTCVLAAVTTRIPQDTIAYYRGLINAVFAPATTDDQASSATCNGPEASNREPS
ncbi:serine hydrolase domain-containing protein [Streptomyces lydicus]|uniref:serine hydrolase domain-containing protein n=1 Tax=Streptomyces lydicus TaxID=47763 RepID=UPI0036E91E1F